MPHLPSAASLFIYSSSGEVPLPPSGGAFHMTMAVTSFLLSKVAGQGPPVLPSPAGLFIYSLCEGVPLLHSPEFRTPGCLCYMSFFFFQLLVYYSVFFSFFPGWGSMCLGAYADLSQEVPCAAYLLTWWSPKQVRSWCLVAREPSWLLHLMRHGDAMCGLGCGGIRILPLLGGFPC
jgi:hypothetical protein